MGNELVFGISRRYLRGEDLETGKDFGDAVTNSCSKGIGKPRSLKALILLVAWRCPLENIIVGEVNDVPLLTSSDHLHVLNTEQTNPNVNLQCCPHIR